MIVRLIDTLFTFIIKKKKRSNKPIDNLTYIVYTINKLSNRDSVKSLRSP